MTDPRIAIVYYSSTGTIYSLACAVAQGAEKAGAEVRLRRVAELAPDDVVRSVPGWHEHLEQTVAVPEATHDDLEWADGYVFGTPTRFGNVAAQLRQFLDTVTPLWLAGILANKPASGFTAAANPHGGQESTLLSLYQTFMHWGSVIVPTGYTDDVIFAAGGNPYGVSALADGGVLADEVLAAARYQGDRVAQMARALAALREEGQAA